jgi:hypothetical protein
MNWLQKKFQPTPADKSPGFSRVALFICSPSLPRGLVLVESKKNENEANTIVRS